MLNPAALACPPYDIICSVLLNSHCISNHSGHLALPLNIPSLLLNTITGMSYSSHKLLAIEPAIPSASVILTINAKSVGCGGSISDNAFLVTAFLISLLSTIFLNDSAKSSGCVDNIKSIAV